MVAIGAPGGLSNPIPVAQREQLLSGARVPDTGCAIVAGRDNGLTIATPRGLVGLSAVAQGQPWRRSHRIPDKDLECFVPHLLKVLFHFGLDGGQIPDKDRAFLGACHQEAFVLLPGNLGHRAVMGEPDQFLGSLDIIEMHAIVGRCDHQVLFVGPDGLVDPEPMD